MTKLLHISDWHCRAEQAEYMIRYEGLTADDADILLVTGDMVPNYAPSLAFADRNIENNLQKQEWERHADLYRRTWPGADIIIVPGNHDFGIFAHLAQLQGVYVIDRYEPTSFSVGPYRITGYRGVPHFGGFWDGEFSDRYFDALVPNLDPLADIILTHTPPYGVLDTNEGGFSIGCRALRPWLDQLDPYKTRIHAFGHAHRHSEHVLFNRNIYFSNASLGANRFVWGSDGKLANVTPLYIAPPPDDGEA